MAFFDERSSRRRFVTDFAFAGGALLAAVAWGWASAEHGGGDPPEKPWRKPVTAPPGEHDHPMPAGDIAAAPPSPAPGKSPTPAKRPWRRNPLQHPPEHDRVKTAGVPVMRVPPSPSPRPRPAETDHVKEAGVVMPVVPPRPKEHDHPPPPGSMPAPPRPKQK